MPSPCGLRFAIVFLPFVSFFAYCKDTTGIRDLEQAAEHLAAHALYLIEVEHATSISYNADMVKSLFR